MKVKKLKEILADMPDDLLVVLSRDPEGNDFSPLDQYTLGLKYLPASRSWQRGIICQDGDARFNSSSALPSLVLWPTH